MPTRRMTRNRYKHPHAIAYIPYTFVGGSVPLVQLRGIKVVYALTKEPDGKWRVYRNHVLIAEGKQLVATTRKVMRFTWQRFITNTAIDDEPNLGEGEHLDHEEMQWEEEEWGYPHFSICKKCKKGVIVSDTCTHCKAWGGEQYYSYMSAAIERRVNARE